MPVLTGSKTSGMFNTPIAYFIFNRPELTRRTFEVIRRLQPATLFIIADGPRVSKPEDVSLVTAARNAVDNIDWDCRVTRIYAEQNQGGRYSITKGLDTVFSQVDECIILEDDCLPDLTFFEYCRSLLAHYRQEENIMTIGGYRCDGPDEFSGNSYFFSKYPVTWGWATWKRVWDKFDPDMKAWDVLRNTTWLQEILPDKSHENYWRRIFDKMRNGLDAWDYALAFMCWLNKGLSIRSKVNLVKNIGFGPDATHTTEVNEQISFRESTAMQFPLQHPSGIAVDEKDEERIEWVMYSGMTKRMMDAGRRRIQELKNRTDKP